MSLLQIAVKENLMKKSKQNKFSHETTFKQMHITHSKMAIIKLPNVRTDLKNLPLKEVKEHASHISHNKVD